MIVVCMVSQEDFNKGNRDDLEYKIDNTWITTKPPVKDYKRYSHGICNDCIKEKYPVIYESLVKAGKIKLL